MPVNACGRQAHPLFDRDADFVEVVDLVGDDR
jgi:hypothetical protein